MSDINRRKLKKIFTTDVINHLKANQNEITEDLLDTMRSYGNEGKKLALEILDIHKDHEGYYLDAFENRIAFNGNRSLKRPFTKLPLYPIHIEEIKRCANDIHYFKDNYVKIRTKSGVDFPELRMYQNDFIETLDSEVEGIIGLMGRQSGKSISTSIYLSHLYCFNDEKNIGIVANKGGMAREFLGNVKNILLELPIWMTPGILSWNKSYIESETDMRILTDVPSADAFRGFSIHVAVMDETAFIRPTVWDEFIDAFLPSQAALSWKKNIILSTPKGMNHFYNLVKGASPHYGTDGSGVKEPGNDHNGYTLFKVDWKDVPRYDKDGNQLPNEVFMNQIINKHGLLYWRQNFECSFLGSSHTLISAEKLQQMEAKQPIDYLDGKLKIYHEVEEGHQYIMSVDASKDGNDYFAVQVVDITGFKFRQVASARLQIDYLQMPGFLDEWCRYYNNPYLIIENNEGAGQSVADQMKITYEYENLHYDKRAESASSNIIKSKKRYPGFRTTPKSRKQILQTMKTFIDNNNLEINDEDTIKEFYTFILINNKYQADDGCHDDMIMALAIIFALFMDTKNFHDMKIVAETLSQDISERNEIDIKQIFTIGGLDDGTFENDTYSDTQESFDSYEEYLGNKQMWN